MVRRLREESFVSIEAGAEHRHSPASLISRLGLPGWHVDSERGTRCPTSRGRSTTRNVSRFINDQIHGRLSRLPDQQPDDRYTIVRCEVDKLGISGVATPSINHPLPAR